MKAWAEVLLLCLFVIGCAGKSIDENDPASLYNDAENEIKNDHYLIAIDKLRTIKNKFPYSKYSAEAQLRIADVYFMEESYTEAAVSYEAFRDLHPKHDKISYALFRIAKAYFKDIPSPLSRDLTPAQKAMDAYQDYLRRFPTGSDATEAKTDVKDIRNILADKELYIADFYFKRDYYSSSKPRYQKIIDTYPETKAAKEAALKLELIQKIPASQDKMLEEKSAREKAAEKSLEKTP